MKIVCTACRTAGKVPPESGETGFPQWKNPVFADSSVPQSQQNL